MGGLNESPGMAILPSLSICFYVSDLETSEVRIVRRQQRGELLNVSI